jgi:MFS transporter, DHA1 family, inner membrane transport protein
MQFKQFMAGIPFVGWAVTFAALCFGLFAAILGAVTPELRAELGSYQRMGVLMMAWVSGGVVGAFQGGRMAHMYRPRPLFLGYFAFALLALALIVWSPHFSVLLIGFFFIAIVESATLTLAHGILADVYTESTARARVISLIDVAFSAGTVITPAIIIGLHQFSTSWRLPYQLYVIPLLAAMLLFSPAKVFLQVKSHADHSDEQTPVQSQSYLRLARIPTIAWCMAAGVFAGFIEWGQYFWYVSYGIQTQGITANAARLGMQSFVAGMLAVRCWQAFFHSRLSLHQKLWRLNLLALAGLAASVLLPHHGVLWLYSLSNFLFGLGVGIAFPILLSLMINAAPTQSSKLSALLMISFTLGAQLAGLLIGNLADWTSVQIAYSTLLGGLVLFTVAVWMIRYRAE